MKKTLSKALLLAVASTSVFAAPDDYQKKSSDKYGDGTIVSVAKEIPTFFTDLSNNLAADQKVEIQLRDVDGEEVSKVIRYSVDAFLGENEQSSYHYNRNRSNSRTGMFPFTVTLTAEDGSDITVEEARLAFGQIQGDTSGITAQIIEVAVESGASFFSDSVERMKTIDLLNIRISDKLHDFDNGNMIIFNGFAKAGWVKGLESYGNKTSEDYSDTQRVEYGSALGVKFRHLLGPVDVTPEVFHRSINFNKENDFQVSRTGFQVNFEYSISDYRNCSAALGFAEEEVEGQYNEEENEIYLSTKCEF